MLNKEIDIQLQNFNQSLLRLKEVLQKNIEADDIVLDATIQRFEFTFENAWKSIKLLLKLHGEESLSPREAIKQAFRHGWIKEEEVFLNLLECRNLTSHTYAKPIAMSVYQTVAKNVEAFDSLYEQLTKQY